MTAKRCKLGKMMVVVNTICRIVCYMVQFTSVYICTYAKSLGHAL